MRKQALTAFLIAVTFRALYCVLIWTPLMKSPEESMSMMYVRSAYLVAAGLGHSQALPGSPAHFDMRIVHDKANTFGTVVTHSAADSLSTDGLYPETLHPPGWALLAAGLHKLFRVPVWFGMQAVGILFDAIACLLLYYLVFIVISKKGVAFTSALIYALFPPLAFEVAGLKPMAFMSMFTIGATVSFVLALRSPSREGRWGYVALCGIVIGVGSYFRSDILLLGPFLALAWIWRDRGFWKPVLAGILTVIVAVAILWPWGSYTNARIGKRVVTSTSLGVNLVNGLGEFPNPWRIGGSDIDRHRDAKQAGLPNAFHPSADPFFKSMFITKVKKHPLAYARIVGMRILTIGLATPYDWGLTIEKDRGLTSLRAEGELLANVGYIIMKYWSHLLSATFMLVCLISTIYMCVKERAQHPLVALFILVPTYFILSHAVIHMEPRYLIPSAFSLFVGLSYVSYTIYNNLVANKVK